MLRVSLLFALAAVVAGAASAQDDLRDRITRHDGRVLTGRVIEPFAETEIELRQGGKRLRVQRADVATIDLIGDRLRTFCERRVRQKDSMKAQSYLIDWADSQGLRDIARLQAMWLVLQDDDNEGAHEYLGHKKGSKGWLWEHEGRSMSREQLEASLAKSPMQLVGERFVVRCESDLQNAVNALLDLEHLGVVWYQRFGSSLQLQETLRPIEVFVHRNVHEFPKWGFRSLPYYEPPPHSDLAHTFYSGPVPTRPDKLFFVGTQGLLYRSLIGEADRGNDRDRVCAWLEVGLGMVMELAMQGPAGFAAPGPLRSQDLQAMQALGRGYRLTHLLHLPMYGSFYLTDDTATAINWSAATMFVTWLLEKGNTPETRDPFLRFVRAALADRKGDSSSAFDEAMGRRVEELDAPWREWLAVKAGY